ncbi:MAG: hypothetical protein CM15mP62_19450 [Rhodospirillaceae bacterium]|nr:MAG: hypothetical protein CM15mP62_19450 [Rhodospirillaceae bacterium]
MHAHKEVIVCTGGVASPQLLELSGIGQAQLLTGNGIEVKHELNGVGEHLRDHINARIQFNMKRESYRIINGCKVLGQFGK